MAVKVAHTGKTNRILIAAFGLIVTFLIVLAVNVLSSRFAARFDVTSTGSLQPSDRTYSILNNLDGESEIVLAANLIDPSRDRAALSRVLDMIDEIDRASASVRTTVINTGTPDGINQYQSLIERLSTERAEETKAAVDITTSASGSLQRLGSQMMTWADPVQMLGQEHAPDRTGSSPWAGELRQRASLLRVRAGEIDQVSAIVEQNLSQMLGTTPVPNVGEARNIVLQGHNAIDAIVRDQLEDLLRRAQDPNLSEAGKASANALARQMQTALDEAGLMIDVLRTSPLPVLSRVASALASGEAAIIIGPDGQSLSAISIDDLAPPAQPGVARIDAGRRAESLLGSALAASSEAIPITTVVLVHGSDTRILSERGALDQLLQSMAIRNVRWIEWPVSLTLDKPAEIALLTDDPNTMYVVVGMSMSTQGAAERAIRTGAVLNELIESGANVLVSLSPSTMQGQGEDDPMAKPLEVFGLHADSGRPTLVDKPIGDRRFVEWEQLILPGESGSPLAEVIAGIPTRLTWPIAIDRIEDIGSAWPLVRAQADTVWRESEWLGYWLERDINRPNVTNPPSPGGSRDGEIGEGVFAWAVERQAESGKQRAVVVGSHLWLFDMVARRTASIDGRVGETSQGNTEFAHAIVSWLTFQDDMIARSAEAESFPIVQPMDPSRLSAARWFFIGGLPILVLIVGAVVRLIGG
jgi:hypothetical protein